MTRLMTKRSVAALLAIASTWLAPVGAAHAQTVGIGRPGDHWASTLAWTHIGRGEKDGAYGYVVKLRADDGCEVELFYPRGAIDFQGQGRTWQNSRLRVKTGWLHYPSRLNARSLPKVHPGVLEVEDHYQRQADGAIAAAQGFALVATLGTMTPLPRPAPLPSATRPALAPAPPAARAAPARAASAGTRSAARGGEATRLLGNATQVFRRGPLTQVGRALTKHPNVIGESGNILQKLGGTANVNARAAAALENILQTGARTVRTTKAFGRVIDYKLPSGIGARFSAETEKFIGFLGRGR